MLLLLGLGQNGNACSHVITSDLTKMAVPTVMFLFLFPEVLILFWSMGPMMPLPYKHDKGTEAQGILKWLFTLRKKFQAWHRKAWPWKMENLELGYEMPRLHRTGDTDADRDFREPCVGLLKALFRHKASHMSTSMSLKAVTLSRRRLARCEKDSLYLNDGHKCKMMPSVLGLCHVFMYDRCKCKVRHHTPCIYMTQTCKMTVIFLVFGGVLGGRLLP